MSNKIEGFKWHLPLAFKDCISQCKFEQGDVIYPHEPKGQNWGESIESIDYLIQVKSPVKTHTNSSGDLDVFSFNWNSKIVFEKVYPNNKASNKIIETTQGRFLTFLLKNDERIFNEATTLHPILNSIKIKDIDSVFIKSEIQHIKCGFAMIYDCVNDVSISKRSTIKTALENSFEITIKNIPLNERDLLFFDMEKYSGLMPTISIELFIINSNQINEVEEELKKVLFKGVKDRFNINTHGLLIRN